MTEWSCTINVFNNTVDIVQTFGDNVNQQTVIEMIKRLYHITDSEFITWPTAGLYHG